MNGAVAGPDPSIHKQEPQADKSRLLADCYEQLVANLHECRLCPRQCRVDRLSGERGFCRAGIQAKVFRFAPHFGEEPPISGRRGSGAIFFSHCTMRCVYCQNHRFSQSDEGKLVSDDELCGLMLRLASAGCHNLNLVTPTQFLPEIIKALGKACRSGFDLPIVYNTSSYERIETVEALDGIVDIYLADAKYADDLVASRYSGTSDYVVSSRAAIEAMWRSVGPLRLNSDGIARRGLIIRHLLLPGHLDSAVRTLEWVASHISTEVAVSLMGQYRPAFEAFRHSGLSRAVSPEEYEEAVRAARSFGFETLFVQQTSAEVEDELFGETMQPSW